MKTKQKHNCAKCPNCDCCTMRANKLIEWVLAQSRLEVNGALGKYKAIPVVVAKIDSDYLDGQE